mgnify:CR=1 FL=1
MNKDNLLQEIEEILTLGFDDYISNDDLYIFIKGNEKYQFHYGSNQFMDKNDQSII